MASKSPPYSAPKVSNYLKELFLLLVVIDPPSVKTVRANFCLLNAQQVQSKLKFLFVLDKSGSNQKRSDKDGNFLPFSGTDMSGERRYNPILDFVGNTPDDPSIYFALINFATTANVKSAFINDHDKFSDLVTKEKNASDGAPIDSGWTNYLSALSSITQLIENDTNKEKNANPDQIVASHYIIFYITDGAPVVSRDSNGNKVVQGKNPDGTDMVPQPVYQAIDALLSKAKVPTDGSSNNSAWIDSIQLHTGFYYAPMPGGDADEDDKIAKEYLEKMAERGQGGAYQFAANEVIDFKSFKIPKRNAEHVLEDVLVTNINTLWDGENLVRDSDGDGLSDQLEIKLGSNPNAKDSDGINQYINIPTL